MVLKIQVENVHISETQATELFPSTYVICLITGNYCKFKINPLRYRINYEKAFCNHRIDNMG